MGQTAPAGLLTVEDVAEMLRMSPTTIQRKTSAGEIRANKVGKRWLYEPDDVMAYVRRGRQRRAAPRATTRKRRAA